MVFHLPFLFTLLPLETGETHRLWVCIFSHMSPAVLFVSHRLCQSFPSTGPFCLLCTLWASKMVCYSMSRFDLILHAERLLFIIFYEEALPGCVWCVCICNASTRSPAGIGVGGIFTFAAILCQHLHPDTDVCVALDRACLPITFSMTTELHSGSNLHLSVMRTKSSSHLEIPALTTGWHKHLTSELCRRTKKCRLTSWHKRHLGTISIMAQISKAILSPKPAVCYA